MFGKTFRAASLIGLATVLALLSTIAAATPNECFDTKQLAQTSPRRVNAEDVIAVIAKDHPQNVALHDPSLLPKVRASLGTSDTLVMVRRAPEITEATLASLAHVPETITVAHNIPTSTADAVRIHGPPAAGFSDSRFAELRAKANASFPRGASVDLGNTKTRDGLAALVSTKGADDLTLVIGHVAGGALRFPDGTGLAIDDLDRLAANGKHGTIWVIGCNTYSYVPVADTVALGIGRRIDYLQAIDIATKIAGTKHRSLRQILLDLQKTVDARVGFGVVSSFVLVIQASDPECEKGDCR